MSVPVLLSRICMSEQVRQRQVILNEGKTLVNTKGVYGSKFGNETHFLSFAEYCVCTC